MKLVYHRVTQEPYPVRVEWDDEARVWMATSANVPGLVTEADSLEALATKLQTMIPELLEVNRCILDIGLVHYEILARRSDSAALAAG